ncbi:MAG: hypothetical protein WA133_08105 [Syntrophales bacterium]
MKNKALKVFATFIALVFLGLAAGCIGVPGFRSRCQCLNSCRQGPPQPASGLLTFLFHLFFQHDIFKDSLIIEPFSLSIPDSLPA